MGRSVDLNLRGRGAVGDPSGSSLSASFPRRSGPGRGAEGGRRVRAAAATTSVPPLRADLWARWRPQGREGRRGGLVTIVRAGAVATIALMPRLQAAPPGAESDPPPSQPRVP